MRKLLLMAAGLSVLAASGCTSYQREVFGSEKPLTEVDETSPYREREEQLLEAAEDEPDDPRVWFALGDFYERSSRYASAATSYEQMRVVIEALPGEQEFTAGHYHLGRVYARMKAFPRAVHHFQKVLELKPERSEEAALVDHFRESHYLLGAIFFQRKQWDAAEKHLLDFKALGGDLRADRMLMDLRYQRERYEQGRSK